jgi:hypothetical protein
MSKENNITLSICGNADSNSGYQQLVAIEPAFYPEDKVYSAVMMNESYYTLQNRTDVTVLIKTINNVCSYGQTREGRLRIGISIPAGLCISNPKVLIDELETTFKANYMTQGVKWQFKRAEYDLNIFSSILQKYPLFPAPTVHRPMTAGGEVAYIFTSNIQELLYDYQYREFQPYGEIVIAEKGTTTEGVINSLAIPRQPVYDVHILRNGKPLEPVDPIIDTGKILDFTVLPEDQSVYQPVSVKFSIDELKSLLSGDKDCEWGQISLDEKQEAVAIKVQSFPEKVFDCRLAVTGETIDMSKIELSNGRFIKTVSATGNFQLKGREIYDTWSVKYPSDWSLTFNPTDLNFQRQQVQSISVSKPKPIAPKIVDTYTSDLKGPKQADDNYILIPVKATIVNPLGIDKGIFANIFMTQNEGNWEYARKIILTKVGEERYEKNTYCEFKGEVPIPKDMLGKGPFIFSVRATVPSSNIHFCKKDIELSKNSPIDLGEDKPGSGIKKSMPLLYAILLALGMLLIGGAAGWGITYWLNSSKETPVQPAPPQPTPAQTTPAQSVPVQPAPVQLVPNQPEPAQPATSSDPANQSIGSSQAETIATGNSQNDIVAEYNKKLARIKTLDFKFSEIAGLKQFLNNQEAKNIEKNKPTRDRLSYHVDVAEKVYKAISFANSTAESIKKAVGSYAATSNTNLDQRIRAAICASYSGDYRDANKKTPYSRSQSNKAVESARKCKSYQDLYYIPDLVLSDKED